jgi:hypothetical protein
LYSLSGIDTRAAVAMSLLSIGFAIVQPWPIYDL